MELPNIFTKQISMQVIERVNTLSASTQPKWGKMNAAQMLAHCNVTYEMIYETKHPKPNAFIGFILKKLVKKKVVTTLPYLQNGKTAPQFVMTDAKDFEAEKKRLIDYITKTEQLGENHFDNKESHSFGNLTKNEWNNTFYKHLNHHLSQFGS
jgi:hypothetical protein